jgi:thioesterase domain-containing protein/acyl carrier protein
LADGVRDVIARTLDAPELGPDDDFYDLGMDSMRAVEVVTLLRDTTGLPLAFEEFDGLRTLSELTDHLRGKLTDEPVAAPAVRTTSVDGHRHLLTRVRAGSAPGNVFFLPPAGGTTAAYIDLSRHLSDPRTLWALSHPTDSADGAGTIRDLARLYTGLVRDQQPTGPYVLAGYSFGGSVAFEMAAELERDGQAVERVVMLDSHPPEAYLGGSADTRAFLAAFPVLVAEILPDARPDIVAGTRPTPVAAGSLEEIVEALADASWSAAMKAELVRFFHVWQANHEALKRWLPDRQLAADIVVLAAQEQENQDIMSLLDIRPTERKVWAQHTTGQVAVLPVPGDHYSMLRSPENLPQVGKAVDRALCLPAP